MTRNSPGHGAKVVSDILKIYNDECERMRVKPDELARTVLHYAQSTGDLDVTNVLFTDETLQAIAFILSTTNVITCVNFTDSLVSTEALIKILKGLESNKSVRKLVLYGNNVKRDGTVALSQLLSVNKAITTLNLKWNNLGVNPNVFDHFCSGLGANEGLTHLDLRSNRIDCEDAKNLATALRRNRTLATLDLRLNNIKDPGAQAILTALGDNEVIETILLKSNPISHAIMIAINERLKNNQTIGKLKSISYAKNNELMEFAKSQEMNHAREMKQILETSNAQLSETRKEADRLAKNLEERLSEVKELTEKWTVTERRWEVEKKKNEELTRVLEEKDKAEKSSSAKIEELVRKLRDKELEMNKVEAARDRDVREIISLKNELEKDLLNEKNVNSSLKNRIREMQASREIEGVNEIRSLEDSRDSWVKKYRELEKSTEDRVSKIREESLDKQQILEGAIRELTEKQSTKLEVLTERTERYRQEKQSLMEQVSSLQSAIARLQQEKSEAVGQNSELNRKIAGLLEEVSSEKIQSHKLQLEKQAEVNAREELKQQVRQTEKELADARKIQLQIEAKHEEALREADGKLRALQRKLDDKKKTIDSIRKDERERTRLLYDAFSRYCRFHSFSPEVKSEASS